MASNTFIDLIMTCSPLPDWLVNFIHHAGEM